MTVKRKRMVRRFSVKLALVTVAHLVRLIKRWTVNIGPYEVPMSISWAGFVVAALLAIWGFVQLG
jgi:hypothetical protein